jgi:flagellar basal-body rod protein FlgB
MKWLENMRVPGIFAGVEELRGSLDYHLARHNVLTANLAHVDTPGFKPLDLARPTASFADAMQSALDTTSALHLGGASTPRFEVTTDPGTAAGLDGNTVSLDRETVKIATNHLRYDAISSLTANELGDLVWAANDGRMA